jgi:hypothetical protein
VLYIEDQHHDLIVVDLVQDSPVTGPDPPGPRISHKLGGLSWPGILGKPVDDTPDLMPDRAVEALKCLTGLIAEDDLVNHRLHASLGLDLIPRDKRLARFDAGASFTSCGGISEVLEQPGQLARGQPLQFSRDCGRDDRGYPFTVLGDVYNPSSRSFMGGPRYARCGLDRQIAHGLRPPHAALRAYIWPVADTHAVVTPAELFAELNTGPVGDD